MLILAQVTIRPLWMILWHFYRELFLRPFLYKFLLDRSNMQSIWYETFTQLLGKTKFIFTFISVNMSLDGRFYRNLHTFFTVWKTVKRMGCIKLRVATISSKYRFICTFCLIFSGEINFLRFSNLSFFY